MIDWKQESKNIWRWSADGMVAELLRTKDDWELNCIDLGISRVPMGEPEIEQAIREAMKFMRDRADSYVYALGKGPD